MRREHARQKWGWALYDWANSAFATTVMAGFFPVFFKMYWNTGVDVTTSTFRLGVANSIASLFVVLMAPVLGAIADQLSRRKAMLLMFAALGIVMTGGLYFVSEGGWVLAVLLYVFAVIGFSGSNVFYDSMLPVVAGKGELDKTSALGFSLGYLGGGLLLAINIIMVEYPGWFGLSGAENSIKVSFLLVSIWWLVFTIPLITQVKEPVLSNSKRDRNVLIGGFVRVWETLHEVRAMRNLWVFLLAYWLYIDGVHTVIRMAVDYGLSLGFNFKDLILALLITQFVGFPSALLFGRIGHKYGARAGILFGLFLYMVITIVAAQMTNSREFYFLAFMIGVAQGGVQALSRSYFAAMIPSGRVAEYFGFYNMLGKFSAIFGPIYLGFVGFMTGSPRVGILSLLIFFIGGAALLIAKAEKKSPVSNSEL